MTDRMVDLVEEGFDLAIRNMLVRDSSLIVRRVGTYRFVACGAPDYLARRGTPRQPGDLAQHNCLIYSHSPWGSAWRFAGPDREQSVALSGNLQANSANALRLAAVQGQGLVMMPSFLVADDIKSGRLVPVLKELLETEYDINAIYPHRHHLSAKVRSFIDLLIEHFRENPAWADLCRSHAKTRQRIETAVDIRRPAGTARPGHARPAPRRKLDTGVAGGRSALTS
jgi:DNA-binding transcriptional LysR family regulator